MFVQPPTAAQPILTPSTAAASTGTPEQPVPIASHTTLHGLTARSCITCRRRKVKCDKQVPCSTCSKIRSQCIFPVPGRAPRRPRTGTTVASEREAELSKRLRRVEGLLEELSGQVELEEAIKHSQSSDNSSTQKDGDSTRESGTKPNSVRVLGMDEGSGTRKAWMASPFNMGCGLLKSAFDVDTATETVGKLVLDEGKSRYVASSFWAPITDEVDEIREMLEEQQDFDSDSEIFAHRSDHTTKPDHQSFVMGYNSSDVNLKSLHPLPSQITFYWQTFLENVQPLTKLLHAPTMNKVIREVQYNLDSLSRSTEALMFSIYFATITSMNTEEVQTNFGVEKATLIKQYRFGTEQALARASFLKTNEIITVQALVLFLVCVRRHEDTRFVWSLSGLAIRIAKSLGLHRDGSKFGLSPFDTEMRRRLWWIVCMLDVETSEDNGSDPSTMDLTFDTEFPSSVNDDDLSPEATEQPVPRPGVSEMTFCLIRYEICSLTQKLTYITPGTYSPKLTALSIEDKEKQIRGCSLRLEEKYLKYCEHAGPLYRVAAIVSRLIIAKMNLIIYSPFIQPGKPNSLTQDVQDRLFISSIEIIEYSQILESEANTKQWGWLFHTYIQWHAMAYILGELSTCPNSTIVERAWRAVDGVFSDWGGVVSHNKNVMLWQPMRKLMAKAQRNREENMQSIDSSNDGSLGIDSKYIRPPPVAYEQPPIRRLAAIEQDLPMPETTTPLTHANSNIGNLYNTDASVVIEPQIGDMSMLSPGQVQTQLQLQQQQVASQQQRAWLMDDNALLDLDMDGDVNWDGWDDLVRDFQMEADRMPDARGPAFGGMGSWW